MDSMITDFERWRHGSVTADPVITRKFRPAPGTPLELAEYMRRALRLEHGTDLATLRLLVGVHDRMAYQLGIDALSVGQGETIASAAIWFLDTDEIESVLRDIWNVRPPSDPFDEDRQLRSMLVERLGKSIEHFLRDLERPNRQRNRAA